MNLLLLNKHKFSDLIQSFWINIEQGKPLASSLCDKTTGRLIRQHQNAKLSFGQNFQKGLK